ncbi:MAG: DUF2226 domain-containing protein [Candidatus Norongarragalinales archaeon]
MVFLLCGKPLHLGLSLAATDVFALAKQLRAKKFCGAIFVTTLGNFGFEEGALFMDSGAVVACSYEYYAFSKKFVGREAFMRFVNACAAQNGVVDVFECSQDELHAVLAENQALLYSPHDKELVKPLKHSPAFEEELAAPAMQKQSLLKKIGFKGF